MISLYLPGTTFLHRMAAGHKILFLCFCSIIVLPVNSLFLIAIFGLFVSGLYILAGLHWRDLASIIKPLMPFLLVIMLLHLWAGTVVEGAVVVTRLLALILLANLISMTTLMNDMMSAMQPAFKPLKYLGINPRKISIAVALMIRFAPVVLALFESLQESWKSRSSAKPRWHLLAPLTIQTLKLTDSVGDALQSRGGAGGLPVRTP